MEETIVHIFHVFNLNIVAMSSVDDVLIVNNNIECRIHNYEQKAMDY